MPIKAVLMVGVVFQTSGTHASVLGEKYPDTGACVSAGDVHWVEGIGFHHLEDPGNETMIDVRAILHGSCPRSHEGAIFRLPFIDAIALCGETENVAADRGPRTKFGQFGHWQSALREDVSRSIAPGPPMIFNATPAKRASGRYTADTGK